jgi:NADPH2:quinone reductase
MRAVVAKAFGVPPTLVVDDVPTPDPGQGEVRIRVTAAGINPVDTYNLQEPEWAGITVGCIPGYDVAGLIDAVGPGVDRAWLGRAAIAMTAFPQDQGAYAEHVVVEASLVGLVSSDVDLVAAASVPLAAGTAYDVVRHLESAGPLVLALGGSGGVGLFFLQLAALAGLRPIAVGRARNHEIMRSHGAIGCVDYNDNDWAAKAAEMAGGKFDSIADLAGGGLLLQARAHLRDDGVITAIATPELDLDAVIDANQTFHGLLIRDNGERMRHLARLFSDGKLRTHVTHRMSLDDVVEAHRLVDSGEAGGKVVLIP